ncbi:MAG: hypothetical protein KGI50_07080, partial [Patescibacteria group bacterium]|nr:hypothetical protein [Patescibacteria group bacterium]
SEFVIEENGFQLGRFTEGNGKGPLDMLGRMFTANSKRIVITMAFWRDFKRNVQEKKRVEAGLKLLRF